MPIVAVAALDAVIQALIAAILLLGLFLLAKVIAPVFGQIPGIGGWLESAAEGIMRAGRDAASSALEGTLHALSSLIGAARNTLDQLIGNVRGALGELSGSIYHLATVSIPRLWSMALAELARLRHDTAATFDAVRHATAAEFDKVRHDTAATFDQLRHSVAAEFDTVRHEVAVGFDAVRHDIAATANAVQAWTAAQIAHVVVWTTSEINAARIAAEGYALQLFDRAEQDIGAATIAAEGFAAAAAARAEHDTIAAVSAAATQGLAIPWPGIITDVEKLQGIIAQDWPDIRDAVGAIPRAIPADLAGTIAMLGALAIPMLRSMEDCVLPQCRNMGGLSGFLKDLLGAASAAAVLGWVAYCIADPVAAADDTDAAGGPLAAATLGGLESLFGIHA